MSAASDSVGKDDIVDLNVGGTCYTTKRQLLTKHPNSLLGEWFKAPETSSLAKDRNGRYFIDRDGQLFRYILDYLRNDQLILPVRFAERQRLLCEAQHYKLRQLAEELTPATSALHAMAKRSMSIDREGLSISNNGTGGYITVGYQGTFSFGPQGLPAADVNFRKVNRILVSGRVSLCREVFGETLNEGRDPDRGHTNDRDRYTARYYLKHSLLEYAFDMLAEAGFKLISSCASGTSGTTNDPKPGSNTEEDRWAHYNEFLFYREP